jgi:FAD/FMN-containing dehydrogenase
MTLKASMLPSRVAAFLCNAETWGETPHLKAHAGNGIVVGHYADVSLESAARLLVKWREASAATVVVKCPPEWKPQLAVWGPPPPDIAVMREVRSKFDPRRVFNPGRFVVD